MAPEILDGTANCSSPLMSPSVCLSREQRHGDGDVCSGGKDSWLQDPSHYLNWGVQSDKPVLHKTLLFSSLIFVKQRSVSLLAFSFFNTCIDHKLTPAISCRICWFSQLHSFFTEQHSRGKPIVCIHGHAQGHAHMQSGISDDIWEINSLSNTIMINFMAVIYIWNPYIMDINPYWLGHNGFSKICQSTLSDLEGGEARDLAHVLSVSVDNHRAGDERRRGEV